MEAQHRAEFPCIERKTLELGAGAVIQWILLQHIVGEGGAAAPDHPALGAEERETHDQGGGRPPAEFGSGKPGRQCRQATTGQ